MDTLNKRILEAYERLQVETINSDFFIIDATGFRCRQITPFFIVLIGPLIYYNLNRYNIFEFVELLLLTFLLIGSFLFFKYKKKIFLKSITFDTVSGLIIYESFLKKRQEFVFTEIKLEKKDYYSKTLYSDVFFYFEDPKSQKIYNIGSFFEEDDSLFDFLKVINSFMLEKDRGKLKPYQRVSEFD